LDRHIQIENSTQTLRCLCWDGYQQPSVSNLFGQASGHKLHGQTHISDYVAADKIITETGHWDLININTPFVRDMLFPAGCVHRLPPDRFGEYIDLISPPYRRFAAACVDATGNILGMPQRFGPFNLVVNTKRISIGMATDQGFSLVHDSALNGRFGILAYEEFNIMHIAISAGLNPFTAMDDMALRRFSATAMLWHNAAAFVTDDHLQMNAMLIDGAVDFYLSGGVYTASPARLAGHEEVYAVTPASGPVDGKGAVAFVEINAVVNHSALPVATAEAFIDFIAGDEGAFAASNAAGACNPVVQMGRQSVKARFSSAQLKAMQWDTLLNDLSSCAEYALIPNYTALKKILQDARNAYDSKAGN
jgi:spermidine/putrescine transport system substrate-binding protein